MLLLLTASNLMGWGCGEGSIMCWLFQAPYWTSLNLPTFHLLTSSLIAMNLRNSLWTFIIKDSINAFIRTRPRADQAKFYSRPFYLAVKPFRCFRASYNQLALNYTEANVTPITTGWLITVTHAILPQRPEGSGSAGRRRRLQRR